MISYLIGKLVYKSPTEIILDVNGVGYSLNISLTTSEKFSTSNGQIKVYTYLHVREDNLQLYGFADEVERDLFRLLISVTGIGPKIAQGMLSGMTPVELKNAIQKADIPALTSLQGIGRKTAERIVLELKDKLGKNDIDISTIISSPGSKLQIDAINALVSLGYNRMSAENAVKSVLRETSSEQINLEELVRLSLRHTSK
ncbi:MAG: Holliday junction DNA helicase RuvA [Ignavibacteriae bacterium]|nr:MAG: Holliday junction DNA helicase RuvA [Ignavibacteriota bacterium]